jgi:hypothetical protein
VTNRAADDLPAIRIAGAASVKSDANVGLFAAQSTRQITGETGGTPPWGEDSTDRSGGLTSWSAGSVLAVGAAIGG